jgi:hypothetical protein
MSTQIIFSLQLVLGYLASWLLFSAYIFPRLRAMPEREAHRAIATLHSFRFFGLVFLVPGVVGVGLPTSFAQFAAYGDFATGVLALMALLTFRIRALFWTFVVAFNIVGVVDFVLDYYHAVSSRLPEVAGQLGAAYVIPVIIVPILMISHIASFYLLLRRAPSAEPSFAR